MGRGRTCICLLSSFILFETKYVRYLMVSWCIFFTRVLILDFGILRLASFSMEFSCMAPLTPVVMVTRGFTFHSLFVWC